MKKYKKIWLPYDKSELGAMTTWLEEQAAQGWRLIKTDSHRMTFAETATETLRYLIAPHTEERNCLNSGWKRIDFLSNNFDIYGTDDAVVKKPNVDISRVKLALYHQVVKHTYICVVCFILAVLSAQLEYSFLTSGFIEFGSKLFLSLSVSTICGFISGICHLRQAKIRSEHLSELAAPRRAPVLASHPKCFTVLIYLTVLCYVLSVSQMLSTQQ